MVVLDCETKPCDRRSTKRIAVHQFELCCATHVRLNKGEIVSRDDRTFHCRADFWGWLAEKQKPREPIWVYSHNANFDMTILDLWGKIDDGDYRIGEVHVADSGGILTGKKPWRGRIVLGSGSWYLYTLGRRGFVRFLSSTNYWPMSLEKLGESINLPKIDIEIEKASDADLATYCRRDCEILLQSMLRLMRCWRSDDCGVWQPTAASLAMTSFRHEMVNQKARYKSDGIYLGDSQEYAALERSAYYGGQITAFFRGKIEPPPPVAVIGDGEPPTEIHVRPRGPIYLIDVTSFYPSLMRKHPYPSIRLRRHFDPPPEQVAKWSRTYGIIASVTIESESEAYPVRDASGTHFAVGRFQTVLAGPELIRALGQFHVKACHSCQLYGLGTSFRRWADKWFTRRAKARGAGDKADLAYCKMVLNSLSGKWAQKPEYWKTIDNVRREKRWGNWFSSDVDTGEILECRGIAGEVQIRVYGDESDRAFPAISAYITAHGREAMLNVRRQCPRDSILYQSTDSLIVDQAAMDTIDALGLVRDDEPGFFRVVYASDEGEICGPNQYRIGDRWIRSGAWGRAKEDEPGHWVYEKWQGIDSTISRKPDGTITIETLPLTSFGGRQKMRGTSTGWQDYPSLPDPDSAS